MHDFRAVALQLVQCLEDKGLCLSEATAEDRVLGNTWVPLLLESGSSSNSFQLCLASAAHALQVTNLLQEKTVQVGSELVSFAIEEEHNLRTQAKNGTRGARSRTGPSA
jgi:hypothetical protein